METTDVHQVLYVTFALASLALEATAAAVAAFKRLWLAAAGFAGLALASAYWLVAFSLWIAIEGHPLIEVQWPSHLMRLIGLCGLGLILLQLFLIPRKRD